MRKKIGLRISALLLAVVLLTAQVPDLRIKSYAVDPITAMAGEELISYVVTAVAAACGVNISSDSSDVAADVRFWVSQMKDDYEIRTQLADPVVVKTVAAAAFERTQEYFQSLADKTCTLVDNGLAVPRDVMDTISAYFNAKIYAYTPDFVQELPYSSYKGVHSGCYVSGWSSSPADSSSNWSTWVTFDFPAGIKFAYVYEQICFYNTTSSVITVKKSYDRYYKGEFYDHGSDSTYEVPANGYVSGAFQYLTYVMESHGIESAVNYGIDNNKYHLRDYLLSSLEQAYGSVADNGVWVESAPSDNWDWTVLDGGLTGTGEDAEVIVLHPTPETPTPDDLQNQLANALVALEVGKVLEDLGFNKKTGADVPTPTLPPDESESPSVDPSESPSVDPSESPGVDPSENPSVNPNPDPSESPNPSESPSESPGVVPSVDPSLDPSQSPEPGGDPDYSIGQAVQAVEGFFQGISAKLDQIIDPFTPENMEKRKLKEVVMTRFPFCIPFDLIDCFRVFEATTLEPRWEIPLDIPSIGFHYVFVLDLTQYPELVQLIRVTTLLCYIAGLVLATRTLIKG